MQVEAHDGWTSRLPKVLVDEWETLCVAWEKAPYPKAEVENPFEITTEFMGEEEALKELEAEDEARRESGGVRWNAVSAAGFIAMGLELEQTCLGVQDLAKKLRTKSHQRSSRQGRDRDNNTLNGQRAPLREKLTTFERLRAVYMPGLLQMLVELEEEVDGASSELTNPEDVKLWLPSSIPPERRHSVCMPDIVNIENQLRTAQCNNSIQSLRHTLRVKSRMVLFKNANIAGQRPGLRSRAIIDRVHERAKQFANRYRRARAAKLSLVGAGDWERVYQVLKDEDVRSYRDQSRFKKGAGRRGTNEDSWEPREEVEMEEEEEEGMVLWNEVRSERRGITRREDVPREGTGETRKINSWIWTAGPGMIVEDGADEENEICRSEWCWSRAWAKRGIEEVMLLKEEMRRVSKFLEWKENWWRERAKLRAQEFGSEAAMKEGLSGYAIKQAILYRELAIAFRAIWTKPLKDFEAPLPDYGKPSTSLSEPRDSSNSGNNNNNNNNDNDDDNGEDDNNKEDEDTEDEEGTV
ncbi:hypothetical protein VKT23_012448 [Stygiomarasmius scandens]|uniref:Uncharacterized protein n=1 Tax=Marasmiellus scandens TaxID=2682957 RepID=A0ABR1JAR6_9AGAR